MTSNYKWIVLTTFLALVTSYASASDEGGKKSWKQKEAEAQTQLDEEITRRTAAGEVMPERVTNPVYAVAKCDNPRPPQNAAVLEFGLPKNYVCDNSDAGKKVIAWRAWYCKDKEREKLCVLGRWDDGLPSYSGQLNRKIVVSSGTLSVVFDRSTWRPESEIKK
ncbi:MAG: hypothetical protein KUG72_12575 [Pseudomonadales bacterium]|nr:hypothetical protein [Pseudomonadales bacterium]